MSPTDDPDDAPVRSIVWARGCVDLQRLGAMLAPVVFRAPGCSDFAPLQVAPWADEPGASGLPGILRRLRGEWPCVPFGRTDRPDALPSGWSARDPGDAWGHGYASNHDWHWLETGDPLALALTLEPPGPLLRLGRTVRAVPDAPALDLSLTIEVREACTLPVALHPTLRLDAGPVRLEVAHRGPGLTYPVDAEPGVSRLAPDRSFDRLDRVPCADGSELDLTRFPLPFDTEELLLLSAIDSPVVLHYLDAGWALQLDWDRALLPDLMLWVSQRGRAGPPWNRRHCALGVEPLNGAFDLGRVAAPPANHPLADRHGLALRSGMPLRLDYRFAAWPERAA